MNFFDLNDDSNDPSNLPNQPTKDLSDWRNIQLGTTPPTILDRLWMPPTTVNPWATPPTPLYPYNQPTYPWTNSTGNQSWSPINSGLPLMNYHSPPLQEFNPADPNNEIIDLTINTSTPIRLELAQNFLIDRLFFSRDFIPVQPNLFPPSTANTNTSPPSPAVIDAELVLVPEIDIEEILLQIETVIPDIDLDAARRTITAMNPLPSTNDLVTNFLDNGYTKKSKKSSEHSSLKRSWSETIDDIPKFLTSYTDPIHYFFDTQRKQSELYINHAKAFLLRAFPTTDKSILEQALQEENFHFLATVRKLEARFSVRTNAFLQRTTIRKSLDMIGRFSEGMKYFFGSFSLDSSVNGLARMPSTSWLIKNNKFAYAIPHTPSEEFYDELRFAKNEVKIRRK